MNKRSSSFFAVYCFFVTFFLITPDVVSSEKPIIKKGDCFPELPLTAPVESTRASYLGINKGKSFTIRDIKADIIWVRLFYDDMKTA